MSMQTIKLSFVITWVLLLLISCGGLPTKEYDEVKVLRARATKYEPVPGYTQSEFEEAESQYVKAEAIFEAEDKKQAKEAKTYLEEARTNYTVVIDNGYPLYASDLKIETDKEKEAAASLKVDVSLEEQYAEADIIYQDAVASFEAKNYETAIDNLTLARDKYSVIYATTKEKYDKSDAALAEAKRRLANLEKLAKELEALQK